MNSFERYQNKLEKMKEAGNYRILATFSTTDS